MSPRTQKQYKDIREEKKALIMRTALEHFSLNGYHATTISHIARHAGISKGLMYNYFRSKEELLQEIIKKSADEICLNLDTDLDGHLSEVEFEGFILRLAELLEKKKKVWRLFFILLLQEDVQKYFSENKNLFTFIPGINRMLSGYFEGKAVIKPPGYDPVIEKNLFITTLLGLALTCVFSNKRSDPVFEGTVQKMIDLYK